ncbi:FHA domain-containing protein [Agromyces bauzanensis]
MVAPDFIVPPPGLIPAAQPDEPERTVQDVRSRTLPAFSPPPGLVPPSALPRAAGRPAPEDREKRIEAPTPNPVDGAWRLRGPGGLEVLLLRPVVLGRDPSPDPGRPDAAVIRLEDPARSVSKTHARIEVVDGRATITDLSSTNGTRVLTPDGEARELDPGRPVEAPSGSTVLLGELAVRLDRVPLDTV